VRGTVDDADAVLVLPGDQPGTPRDVIDAVCAAFRASGADIVSVDWNGVHAPPVLFSRGLFEELMELEGDAGARVIVDRHREAVDTIRANRPPPIDVDSSADLERLRAGEPPVI
jgi:molybdenum cofactor cytidylyltransferase